MAGGTWTTQNEVRPGIFINFASKPKPLGAIGERGITSMALALPWGAPQTLITIHAGDDIKTLLGYDVLDADMLLIKEALKRAQTLLLYRLNTGTKAAATHGTLTVTAKYGGLRGNDITVIVQVNVDDASKFDVITLLSGVAVHTQTVASVTDVASNDWADFTGTGTLTVTAGVNLIGGENGTVTNQNHTDYLAAVELQDFQTIALISADMTLKSLYASFVKRLRESEGKKVQAVLENYPSANHEGVISVKNGVILTNGTALTAAQATAWVAGATASAGANESLTYSAYDDAVDVMPRYTNTQISAALLAGEFLFTAINGLAVVEQDINTLTGFTPEKGKAFSKNRVIRVLDGFANDISKTFHKYYIGKVDNNEDGRGLFKSEIISYMTTQQGIQAIQNFAAQTDVSVSAGSETDSIYVEIQLQPVDSVEKIYMKVQVN